MIDLQKLAIFIITNWRNITTIIAYFIAIASIIVKFTPTLKDDLILLKIIKFLSKYIALNRGIDDNHKREIMRDESILPLSDIEIPIPPEIKSPKE